MTFSLMPDLTGSSSEISAELTGRKLNIYGRDIVGASAPDFTSATKAFMKALGTHSRIPLFHGLSNSIASLDEARRKSSWMMKGKFVTISVGEGPKGRPEGGWVEWEPIQKLSQSEISALSQSAHPTLEF